MAGNLDGFDAFLWFVAMTAVFFGMLAFGTYLAVNSYARGRGVVHFHRPHLRHRHGS